MHLFRFGPFGSFFLHLLMAAARSKVGDCAAGATPVPDRAAAKPPAVRVPARGPEAVGVKVTFIVQLTGRNSSVLIRVGGQSLVWAKSPPAMLAAGVTTSGTRHRSGTRGSAVTHLTVRVKGCGELIVPTVWMPKSWLSGVSDRALAVGAATPRAAATIAVGRAQRRGVEIAVALTAAPRASGSALELPSRPRAHRLSLTLSTCVRLLPIVTTPSLLGGRRREAPALRRA